MRITTDFCASKCRNWWRELREQFAKEIAAKEKTIIPGDEIDIDFTSSTIHGAERSFPFPALGSVPQSLVIAEGVENLVAKRLALTAEIAESVNPSIAFR